MAPVNTLPTSVATSGGGQFQNSQGDIFTPVKGSTGGSTSGAASTANYKVGGWYNGRQWDGSQLGAPNQITVGDKAGTQVSAEVLAQGSKLQTPNDPKGLANYFADYQNRIKNSLTGKDLAGSGSGAALGNAINSNRPEPPKLADTFDALSGKYGVNDLNKSLNDLQAQARTIQESVRTAAHATENQPGVTADVVGGRESEQQRVAQDQLDSLNLQITAVSNQLNTANNAISMYMGFAQQDYTNASQAYDAEVSQYIQMQQLVNSTATTAESHSIASMNFIANHLGDGSMTLDNMTPADSTKLDKLAISAGFPAGTLQSIGANALAKSRVSIGLKQLMTKPPTQKITNKGFGIGSLRVGEQTTWEYFNPLANNGSGAWETKDNQADAIAAQNVIISQVNSQDPNIIYDSALGK